MVRLFKLSESNRDLLRGDPACEFFVTRRIGSREASLMKLVESRNDVVIEQPHRAPKLTEAVEVHDECAIGIRRPRISLRKPRCNCHKDRGNTDDGRLHA